MVPAQRMAAARRRACSRSSELSRALRPWSHSSVTRSSSAPTLVCSVRAASSRADLRAAEMRQLYTRSFGMHYSVVHAAQRGQSPNAPPRERGSATWRAPVSWRAGGASPRKGQTQDVRPFRAEVERATSRAPDALRREPWRPSPRLALAGPDDRSGRRQRPFRADCHDTPPPSLRASRRPASTSSRGC